MAHDLTSSIIIINCKSICIAELMAFALYHVNFFRPA